MREDPQQDRRADVIYEDSRLLVCIKPRGVLACKDASGKLSMNDLLAPREVYPVHRLDKEVTGLMVFAKDPQCAAHLSQTESLVKEYRALCKGRIEPSEGIMEDLLFHDRQKNKTYVVKGKRAGVKPAKLSYSVLEYGEDRTLVHVHLYTGRTHQIRVQFASRGYPLIGDRKYGGTKAEGIGLESYHLQLHHPDTGKWMEFWAEGKDSKLF